MKDKLQDIEILFDIILKKTCLEKWLPREVTEKNKHVLMKCKQR